LVRAVFDANDFVSAVIRPEGTPGRLIERFLREQAFEIVASPAIVSEVTRVLAYPKVRGFILGLADPLQWFQEIIVHANLVSGEAVLSGICEDPDDEKYIAAAIEGRARFVVTGDRKLLAVKRHEHIRMVGPRAFLSMLD
jgi:putative PIN family toxin of toxin-antitoxin system